MKENKRFLEKLVNEERMSKGASRAVKKGCGERENMTFRFYTLMRDVLLKGLL